MKYHALFGIKTTLDTLSRSTKIYLIELAFTSIIYPTIISINTKSTSLNSMHKHIAMNYANARIKKKQPTPNWYLRELFSGKEWLKKYNMYFEVF